MAIEVNLTAVQVGKFFGTPESLQTVLNGIEWVIQYHKDNPGPAVACLAVSGPPNPALDEAVRGLVRAGITVVVPAGDVRNPAGPAQLMDAFGASPGRILEVITVGALDAQDRIADFSKRGPGVNIWAPGETIRSASATSHNGSEIRHGTAQAAAFVTGIAACILSLDPMLSPAQVGAIINLWGLRRAIRNRPNDGGEYLMLNNIISLRVPDNPGPDDFIVGGP